MIRWAVRRWALPMGDCFPRWIFGLALCMVFSSACARAGIGHPLPTPSPWIPTPTRPRTALPTRTITPKPTATPTRPRTVLPTYTAVPTPTRTPQPTASPTPTPISFPEATRLAGGSPLPPLPADLYFIRYGGLWRWPRSGGSLEPIVAPPTASGPAKAPTGVLAYRLDSRGQRLVYAFATADPSTGSRRVALATLDLTTGVSTSIPMAAASDQPPPFDITPDGRYVIDIAWRKEPDAGTIVAVDAMDPQRSFELGDCLSQDLGPSMDHIKVDCMGFMISPDSKRIAFSDGRGMWLSDVPNGSPRLLAEHRRAFCGIWVPKAWLPDPRYLLIEIYCYEGASFAVMDAQNGRVWEIPNTFFHANGYRDVAWSLDGRQLVIVYNLFLDPSELLLELFPPSGADAATILLSEKRTGFHIFSHPYFLWDGRIGFVMQSDAESAVYGLGSPPGPGIFVIRPDGTGLERTVSLPPALPCPAKPELQPDLDLVDSHRLIWAPDGLAFLYLDCASEPQLLGRTDGSALWDVRELLEGARDFQWGRPVP